MSIKGIVFDLDGTLLYTLEDLKNSLNFALNACNMPKRTLEEVRNFVGNGIKKLIERSLDDNQEKFDECYKIFLSHYAKNSLITTKPYNGVISGLKKLKENNIKLAILSNKIDVEVKRLSKYFFDDIFNISMGETSIFPKKPDPKALLEIIKEFNLSKDEIYFIGDSEVDIQTAKNADVQCLSVLWGYKDKDFLIQNNAKNLFENFEQMVEFILKN